MNDVQRKSKGCLKILLFVALCMLLCGCFDPGLQSGWITAKYYDPGYSYYSGGYSTKSCTGTYENRHCHYIYHSGHFVYVPASYSLDINSCKYGKGKDCKSNIIYVDQHDYDSYSVNQYYGSE